VERLGPWPARLTWFALPLLAGPSVGDALDGASAPVQAVSAVGLYGGWAAVLVATLVPATVSLTVLRLAAPTAVLVTAVAAAAGGVTGADVLAVSATVVALLAALWPVTGQTFADGSAYGDERRWPLRPPGTLLAGPVPLVWAVVVAGVAAGPLLLAARVWVAGAAALVVGAAAVWWGVRVLHTLARRWIVFVPAGLVVHDPLVLAESVLVPRATLRALEPAPADTAALDLTRGAFGLALEITLTEPTPVLVRRGRGATEAVTTGRLLVTPTRPGALLTAARQRRLG
jgi:hypothetical protein